MLCFGLWAVPTAARTREKFFSDPIRHTAQRTPRVPGTSERQPLTYEGVMEPGASGWAGFCAEPARTAGASWMLGTGAIDTLLRLPLLLLASGELATTAGIAPDIGRGEPAASGDMAPDCGRGEATGDCDQLPAGANEPDDRGPRGELLKSVASICTRKRVTAMRAKCLNVHTLMFASVETRAGTVCAFVSAAHFTSFSGGEARHAKKESEKEWEQEELGLMEPQK